jgi:DNA-binding NtrC family response regulator
MITNIRILHIDDCPFIHDRIRDEIRRIQPKWRISWCDSLESALRMEQHSFEIILCDFDLGPYGSVNHQTLMRLRQHLKPRGIIALSQHEQASVTKNLMQMGFDLIENKSNPIELLISAIKSLTNYSANQASSPTSMRFGGQFATCVTARIPKLVASAVRSIHIYGESGSGKEVVCDLFQTEISSSTPIIRVNCAAIAPNLIQSELFGYEKGAFTGASHARRGLIEAAHGGFIFLDEVALLSPEAQASLLRAIENREVRRIGSDQARQIDVKFISATNVRIEELVAEGRFRQDLWQRLSEVVIAIPPLRERKSEIPSIIESLMNAPELRNFSITPAAIKLLSSLDWQDGNIRALRNCLRAMTENHQDNWLTPNSIPTRILESSSQAVEPLPQAETSLPEDANLRPLSIAMQSDRSLEEISNIALLQYLKSLSTRHQLSTRRLASILKISRSTLATRFQEMIHSKIATYEELSQIIGSKFGGQRSSG